MTLDPVPSCSGLEAVRASAVPYSGTGPQSPVEAVDALSGVEGERVPVADDGVTEF